jgi:hypothetical protein
MTFAIHPLKYAPIKQLPRFDFVILENVKSAQRLLNLSHPVLRSLSKAHLGILVQTRPGEAPLKNLRLTAVRQIKILGSITPGQSLHLSGSLQGMLDTLGQVIGEIRDDAGNVIITGSVTLAGEK